MIASSYALDTPFDHVIIHRAALLIHRTSSIHRALHLSFTFVHLFEIGRIGMFGFEYRVDLFEGVAFRFDPEDRLGIVSGGMVEGRGQWHVRRLR